MPRTYVYITFFSTGERLQAQSVSEARAHLRQRYPNAHFGQWEEGLRNLSLAVWENAAARLRFELGEKEDRHRPVAYIVLQDWRLPVKIWRVKVNRK